MEQFNERKYLKDTGILAVIVLAASLGFWIGFSEWCLGGYSGGPQAGIDIGINSRATTRTNLQPGSSGTFILRFGTESVTGAGTATGYMSGTDTAYPRAIWTPATGKLNFVGVSGFPIMLQVEGVDVGTSGSSIAGNNGYGTNTTFANPTLSGNGTWSGTLNLTGTITANGQNISAVKVSYLDATSSIQTQIDGKQVTLGYTPLSNATGSVTSALGSQTADKLLDIDYPTTKAVGQNLKWDGSNWINATSSASVGFGGVIGTPTDNLFFTSTPGANKVIYRDSNPVSTSWLDNAYTGTQTFQNTAIGVITGSATAYGSAYKTATQSIGAGTWTNVVLHSSTRLYNTTFQNSEQIKVLVPGVYRISGKIQARTSAASVALRICKNNQVELDQSFSHSYMNYGDGNSGMPVISEAIAYLVANDYVYLQTSNNHASSVSIDYAILGSQPSPGTHSYAFLTVSKIGN